MSRNAYAYFNPVDAYLTRLAFEKNIGSSNIPLSEFELSIRETREWLDDLDAMRKFLENYLKTRNNAAVKEFERLKTLMIRFKGIGAFWTALLNIRLNSVPLLDPNEGINKSLEACRETFHQISYAIGHYGL